MRWSLKNEYKVKLQKEKESKTHSAQNKIRKKNKMMQRQKYRCDLWVVSLYIILKENSVEKISTSQLASHKKKKAHTSKLYYIGKSVMHRQINK